jgi:hypothetical protein
MNTLWKGIEKIYNFGVKGLTKIRTHNPQNMIDLLLHETATRRKNCLTCTRRWAAAAGEGRLLRQGREEQRWRRGRAEAAQGKRGGGRKRMTGGRSWLRLFIKKT